MKPKISQTLENIMARVVFETTRRGVNTLLKDRLALEILKTESSLAHQLVAARLRDWEIRTVLTRMAQRIHLVSALKTDDPSSENFFRNFREELCSSFSTTPNLSTAHALVALLSDRRTNIGHILEMYGIDAFVLSHQLHCHTDGYAPEDITDRNDTADTPQEPADDTPSRRRTSTLICKYGADLTRMARDGKIDPVTGRDAEIERMVQILSRRKKNNPILIGEAGVGKSAIVEGLALRLASGDVPATIAGKRLISVDLAALLAGTKYRGEFEERMQQLLDELKQADDILLFIDEIHTIVGAGSTNGSLDTANLLKPALARGEIQTIGATTFDEYRQNILSDAALERRFQKVIVEPTSKEQTLSILRHIAPHYERHHNVHFTDEALTACVELAERYITERHFPDKAVDLMDEAGSRGNLLTSNRNAPLNIGIREIREVITAITGIPAEELNRDTRTRFSTLHAALSRRIIGQPEAVERVAKSIGRSGAGLRDERRPIGVFLFVGPTGVGKTLMAKELSRSLFDSDRGLLRFDMSEYGEKHNLSRLIGPPPGYVGYGEGGQLTEAVRRQPYSVILFDEIEKAHRDIFNIMLQIFDEGHLTDGSGRRVDFRHTIIIMTSNLGAHPAPRPRKQVGYSTTAADTSESALRHDYLPALEQHFAPEFMNRIDDIVIFRRLSADDTAKIIDLELSPIIGRAEQLGYTLRITEGAKRKLSQAGFESRYGVRSLRRTLKEQIEEPLSQLILTGAIDKGATVIVESGRREGIRLKVA